MSGERRYSGRGQALGRGSPTPSTAASPTGASARPPRPFPDQAGVIPTKSELQGAWATKATPVATAVVSSTNGSTLPLFSLPSAKDAAQVMHERLVYFTKNLTGQHVEVTLVSGVVYKGIFHTIHADEDNLDLVLNHAHIKLQDREPNRNDIIPTIVIPGKDFAQVTVTGLNLNAADRLASQANSFQTDSAISGYSGSIRERELVAWNPDNSDEDFTLEETSSPRDSSWDQFQVNRQLFGVETSFNEELYTTRLDTNSSQYRKREKEAEQIAQAIARGTGSRNSFKQPERDEENGPEIDEEDKYSAVRRTKPQSPSPSQISTASTTHSSQSVSAPTSTVEATADLSLNGPPSKTYIPPAKRTDRSAALVESVRPGGAWPTAAAAAAGGTAMTDMELNLNKRIKSFQQQESAKVTNGYRVGKTLHKESFQKISQDIGEKLSKSASPITVTSEPSTPSTTTTGTTPSSSSAAASSASAVTSLSASTTPVTDRTERPKEPLTRQKEAAPKEKEASLASATTTATAVPVAAVAAAAADDTTAAASTNLASSSSSSVVSASSSNKTASSVPSAEQQQQEQEQDNTKLDAQAAAAAAVTPASSKLNANAKEYKPSAVPASPLVALEAQVPIVLAPHQVGYLPAPDPNWVRPPLGPAGFMGYPAMQEEEIYGYPNNVYYRPNYQPGPVYGQRYPVSMIPQNQFMPPAIYPPQSMIYPGGVPAFGAVPMIPPGPIYYPGQPMIFAPTPMMAPQPTTRHSNSRQPRSNSSSNTSNNNNNNNNSNNNNSAQENDA